jgi:hypothetical protein
MCRVSHLIAALTVSLLAMLGILSCTADSSESGKTATTDSSTPSSAGAPDSAPSMIIGGAAPTPVATPPAWERSRHRTPGMSFPPDTTNYARPARPGEKTP